MERRFQSDFRIVQAIGFELNFGPAGASAKEVDGAAFADHVDRPLPGFRLSDGFDHDVASALLRRKRANGVDYIRHFGSLNDFVSAHLLSGLDLAVTLYDGNYVASDGAGDLHKHQADGPTTQNCDRIADLDSGFVEAAKNAGQRFSHGCVFKCHIRRDDQHVGFDNAAWNANVFRVGTVVEEQVFAEILLVFEQSKHIWQGAELSATTRMPFLKPLTPAPLPRSPRQAHDRRAREERSCARDSRAGTPSISAAGQCNLDFNETSPSPTRGMGTFSILRSSLPYKTAAVIFPFTACFLPNYCRAES